MKLYWSDHAVDRVRERFADQPWRIIPEKRILRKAKTQGIGMPFFLRQGGVKYVLKRVEEDRVLVVTVLASK